MSEIYKYDVALSFAGKNREYVEEVATFLESYGVKVFYDKFEQADLWGKDLYYHLNEIYKKKAKYTIMFISKAYAESLWTNHERKSAQARAFNESKEYILPIKFDDTEIKGLDATVAYLDATVYSSKEVAQLFIQKTDGKIRLQTKSVPINEESHDFPIIYKNSVYLWHTTASMRVDTDLMERSQVQIIVDTDSSLILDEINRVIYYLHPTFENNKKIIKNPKNQFLLKFKAWGSFQLKAEVYFNEYKKPLVLYRYINLHTF